MSEEIQQVGSMGVTTEAPENQAEAQEVQANSPEVSAEQPTEPKYPNQESVQKAIDKQHHRFREEERKRQETEQQLKQVQEELAKYKPQDQEIEIPPIPDQWDEDYQAKIEAREAALIAKREQDLRKQIAKDQQFQDEQKKRLEAQQQHQARLQTYGENAKKAGISEDSLIAASNRVADVGVMPEIAEVLLTHNDGPKIVAFLADSANVVELHRVSEMNALQFGMEFQALKDRALAFNKPNVSKAPLPVDTVISDGRAPDLDTMPAIAGATFE